MSEQKQKRPAHEVIIEDMELALHKMERAQLDVDRGYDAARDLIWAQSSLHTLLQVLEQMVIPEDVHSWIVQKLRVFADRTPPGLSPFSDIQRTIKRL